MDAQVASVSLLAITSSVSIFNSFCPPLHEVRQAKVGNQPVTNDVRVSELAAVSLTVAIGLIGSGLTNSPVPAMLSVLAALCLVGMYEGVLQMQPQETKS